VLLLALALYRIRQRYQEYIIVFPKKVYVFTLYYDTPLTPRLPSALMLA